MKTISWEGKPIIGMGTFGSDKYQPAQIAEAVGAAVDIGYRMFDCASVYGNEAEVGLALESAINAGKVARDELFVISKVWNDMHGRGDVLLSCARTLRDLRLDYVDLYLVHWPFPNFHAPGCDGDARNPDSRPFDATEYASVWRQMERLYFLGLARNIGMSNMTVSKLDAVLPSCMVAPAAIEMELHPSFQQPGLFRYCVDKGIKPIGYSPIGSPSRPERDRTQDDVADTQMPEIVAIAQAHGVHPAEVCLKWAVQRGQIPIPFSVNGAKLASNFRAVHEDPLTQGEMDAIAGIDKNCRLIKGQVFLWEGATGWHDIWD